MDKYSYIVFCWWHFFSYSSDSNVATLYQRANVEMNNFIESFLRIDSR